MGWRPEEGYYQRHEKGEKENISYKLTAEQEKFNNLDPDEIKKGIDFVQAQLEKANKDISKVHLDDENMSIENISLKKGEKIEYVVEEKNSELKEEENER